MNNLSITMHIMFDCIVYDAITLEYDEMHGLLLHLSR